MPRPRLKQPFRKFAMIVLLSAIPAMAGWVVIGQSILYTGTVYRCSWADSSACTREPLAGKEVYLLSSFDDQPSPSTVLQVTTSDAAGRYWFFGPLPGAVAAVRVGNYQSNTWLNTHGTQPYCAFAINGWGTVSHDIELYNSDDYRTVIGDFGGLYMTLKICPQALR